MGTRPSVTASVGIALIVLPILLLAGYGRWLGTRNFTPLDVPVLFSRGHIRTHDFYVDVTGQYFVDFKVDYPLAYDPECLPYGPKSVLVGHLELPNGGRVLWETDEPDYFGSFDIEKKGHY